MSAPRLPLALALVLAPLLAAAPVRGESALRLPLPESFGEIPADTYDEAGHRVGDAALRILRLEDGRVQLEASSGIEGAERTVATAEFVPVDGGEALRLVRQRSSSFDASEQPLGVLSIDHERGEAVCAPPAASGKPPRRIPLPNLDRVANVPLNLLFLPLARGQVQQVDFQILLCRGGPRFVNATARVAHPNGSAGVEQNGRLVEIRTEIELGLLLSHLVRPFLPQVSFWFDPSSPAAWIAHRMPLFSRGPTVVVVRSGFSPSLLGFSH